MICIDLHEGNRLTLKSTHGHIFSPHHKSQLIYDTRTKTWSMELDFLRHYVLERKTGLTHRQVFSELLNSLNDHRLGEDIFVHEIDYWMEQVERRFA
jgi:hypothetical protein